MFSRDRSSRPRTAPLTGVNNGRRERSSGVGRFTPQGDDNAAGSYLANKADLKSFVAGDETVRVGFLTPRAASVIHGAAVTLALQKTPRTSA